MGLGWLLIAILLALNDPGWATEDLANEATPVDSKNESKPQEPWYKNIQAQWGGHLKARGSVSWVDNESFFHPVGTGTYYDGNTEGRLKNKLYFAEWGCFDTHYEIVLLGGDTWQKGKELETLFPDLFGDGLLVIRPVEDDRQFMDLSKVIHENDDFVLYNRLDRLYLTLLPKWGVVRIGRQAVTWGDGFIFNPMDLFNPFPPTDIERDYKIGEDMVYTQVNLPESGDFESAYVPRRDPSSGDVEWDQSTLAGKLHFAWGTTEFDVMAAHDYDEVVVGLGTTRYLGGAAWRADATWTFLGEDSNRDDYLSLVANMDYSWVWWGKNFYGFLEFYFNGLGVDDYTEVFTDPDLLERLDRGGLLALGRYYLSCHIRMELHPLLNIHLTVINNLSDPSGVIQPWATWDLAQDFQMTFGGNIFYGGKDTEFGGFERPGTDLLIDRSDRAFLWLSYYF